MSPRLRRTPNGSALVVAHRGAWNPAPQNSPAAFEQAIAIGADAIELDVRRSADGRLVVVHDARLGMRPVAHLRLDEVRARMREGQAPELGETLRALAGRIAVDVELKEDGYVEEAMGVVAAALPTDGYVVTSFLDDVLPQVRAAVPEARIGLLVGSRRRLRQLPARLRDAGADFVAPHVSLVGSGALDTGLPAWVWTVNDARLRDALAPDPRVEAIITDRARRAVAARPDTTRAAQRSGARALPRSARSPRAAGSGRRGPRS